MVGDLFAGMIMCTLLAQKSNCSHKGSGLHCLYASDM